MARLTFWFEFASTYSHLTAQRIAGQAQAAGVEIIWQPFLLGPIFAAQGWDSSPFNIYPAKGKYMWRDMARRAEVYGLPPVVPPDPFPQNGLLAARIATIGAREPWGPDFVRGVYEAQFARGETISDAEVLGRVLTGLGLDADALIAQARTDQHVKNRLREATEQAMALGIFGAPSFTTADGELFWGDDRLEDALEWAARG